MNLADMSAAQLQRELDLRESQMACAVARADTGAALRWMALCGAVRTEQQTRERRATAVATRRPAMKL